MFKSSENLRLAAEMRALQRVAAPWRETRTTWFDGTPDSVEARLAATERVLAHARSGYTAAHLALTAEAETARRELLAAKHRLLTDFLDDGARAFQGSKRVADMYVGDLSRDRASELEGHMSEILKRIHPTKARLLQQDLNELRDHIADQDDFGAEILDDNPGDYDHNGPILGMAGERGSSPYDHYPQAQEWLNGHSEPEQMFLAPLPSDQEWISRGAPHHGSRRTADETTGFGKLGPGYEHFGDDDFAEYDDYLRRHDYHTDHRALEHRLRPEMDEDDPARYSYRTAAGFPGVNPAGQAEMAARAESELDEDMRGNYYDGPDSGECRHCGERIEERRDGSYGHVLGENPYTGDTTFYPDDDHSAEPDDDDYHTARRLAAPQTSVGEGGAGIESLIQMPQVGTASTSIPGAAAKMMWNGATMTGQETAPPFNPGPKAAALRVAAAAFVADQNTTDRGELMYRAHRHASNLTGQLPVVQAREVVKAFVAAVNREIGQTAAIDHRMSASRGTRSLEIESPESQGKPRPTSWFHTSRSKLPVGTKLVPGGGESDYSEYYENEDEEERQNHVWLEADPQDLVSKMWASPDHHIYQVQPEQEPSNKYGWDGWVTPSAVITKYLGTGSDYGAQWDDDEEEESDEDVDAFFAEIDRQQRERRERERTAAAPGTLPDFDDQLLFDS